MQDIYAALLLHAAGQPISEDNVSKVLGAAGVKQDATKVKALVAALEGVNIDEAVKQAAFAPAAAQVAGEAKKDEKKPEESQEKKEEEAAAGLAALFG
ncbi:TPA: 50S ribosomal protein P1 [Candidatus Micrarchaeota archaeon]|nr:50S ribosomal protein P1 [Candidatus Micrarchaeota archaeon]